MTQRMWVGILLVWLVGRGGADEAKPIRKPDLRDELLRRVKVDQEARKALIQWMAARGGAPDPAKLSAADKLAFERLAGAVQKVDRENREYLQKIVEQHGWPGASLVGKEAAHAAWLLVQHADAAPKFQRACLDRMTRLPADEVSRTDVAYLTDRVLLAEGKKQLYGTQFIRAGDKWVPRPIEDEANVDRRRSAAGLPSLAEYAKQLAELYDGKGRK